MAYKNIVEEMNAYYAMHAPWHDGCMGYTSNEEMEKLLGPIIAWFEDYVWDKDVLEIACGTGNWTQVLARRARSVLGTDLSHPAREIAQQKTYEHAQVTFKAANAYALEGLTGTFGVAFAADWWSHIPKSWIPGFVEGLFTRLDAGARVILIDMLPREELDRMFSHYDDEGNATHLRRLPTGEVYHVVRNVPSEQELRAAFKDRAATMEYREHDPLRRWMFTLTTK
jgi:demethylmenaquinone methyltransferase/2-methoxy-6-polyprenyl-1,4-benzoquinol methylase